MGGIGSALPRQYVRPILDDRDRPYYEHRLAAQPASQVLVLPVWLPIFANWRIMNMCSVCTGEDLVMAAASERIPILVTRAEKARITRKARQAGLSVGEFFRQAASVFEPKTEDSIVLEGMIGQIEQTTQRASAAIDDALAHIEASEKRIASMEREALKTRSNVAA
jgi:hypothetical protein